ncbi:MAG: 50S ribosomal protein L29 [Bdellovibrionales bacterium]|nr:50S ribosomal protein L29 [Bdellovibrionales bacterium]
MKKFSEIRDLTVEELRKRMLSSREELFEMTMKHSMGQLAAPSQIRDKRRSISRIKTALSMKLKTTRGQK